MKCSMGPNILRKRTLTSIAFSLLITDTDEFIILWLISCSACLDYISFIFYSKLATPANNATSPSGSCRSLRSKSELPDRTFRSTKIGPEGIWFSHRSDLKRYGIWKLTGPFSNPILCSIWNASLIAMSSSCLPATDRYIKRKTQRWDSTMPKGVSLSVKFSPISVPFFSAMCQRKVFIFNSKLYRHNRNHYQIFYSHHKVMKDVNTNWRDSFKHRTVFSWM